MANMESNRIIKTMHVTMVDVAAAPTDSAEPSAPNPLRQPVHETIMAKIRLFRKPQKKSDMPSATVN